MTSPIPNIEIARDFLHVIAPAAREFTFQTYDDDKERKSPKLAKVLHGTLDEHWPELMRLNSAGAGVAYTVNETDLLGRTKANIKRIRCVFCEADEPGERKFKIPPELTVESSPGRFHFYWRVTDMTTEQFTAVMEIMIREYASCEDAKDISRVPATARNTKQKTATAHTSPSHLPHKQRKKLVPCPSVPKSS